MVDDTGASGRRRERVVADGLARFCRAQGFGDPVPSHLLIEAFCAQGLSGRTDATKGTYRSVLRRQAGMVLSVGRPGYRGAGAKAPYTGAERAELMAICCAQPKRWRGEAALVVVALGVGAGLRASELVAVTGGDVRARDGRVVVSVSGPRSRTVAVETPFAEVATAAAQRVGDDHLVHPGPATRRYPNFVNGLCAALVRDPDAPRLTVARCRASYVCDRLAEQTTLADVLAWTGIGEVESLLRYACLVEGAPSTKAALRRALAEGR